MSNKKREPESVKRGSFHPHKDDVTAFTNGELTAKAKRLNAIVDKAFRYNDARKKAVNNFETRMDNLFKTIITSEQGISVMSVDGTRRVTKSRKSNMKGNVNAFRAKALIDEFVSEILSRKAVSQDEINMTAFLKNVIQESKGRILMTKTMIDFKRQTFIDPRLQEAQKLLNDAFDVTDSKTYYYCEVFDEAAHKWVAA